MKKPISLYHPALYRLRVTQRRLFCHIKWLLYNHKYAAKRSPAPLSYRYIKHTSKLIRRLGNSDIQLQHNKITNLKIAVDAINGTLIRPNEYFSFCKLVGKPTKSRGFVEGMELSFGEARAGIGGGICQLSNLIHWMAIHSPLQVTQRANHSFDPFPDDGRVLPFGSGAAIFYNFIDLVLFNPTQQTFQLRFKVGTHQLEGELLSDQKRSTKYHIYEKNHRFIQEGGQTFRLNEIWRDILTTGHDPKMLSSECLYKNKVIVKYPISKEKIEGSDHH